MGTSEVLRFARGEIVDQTSLLAAARARLEALREAVEITDALEASVTARLDGPEWEVGAEIEGELIDELAVEVNAAGSAVRKLRSRLYSQAVEACGRASAIMERMRVVAIERLMDGAGAAAPTDEESARLVAELATFVGAQPVREGGARFVGGVTLGDAQRTVTAIAVVDTRDTIRILVTTDGITRDVTRLLDAGVLGGICEVRDALLVDVALALEVVGVDLRLSVGPDSRMPPPAVLFEPYFVQSAHLRAALYAAEEEVRLRADTFEVASALVTEVMDRASATPWLVTALETATRVLAIVDDLHDLAYDHGTSRLPATVRPRAMSTLLAMPD